MRHPHELCDDQVLGGLAQSLVQVVGCFCLLQHREGWRYIGRMRETLHIALRSLDALEEHISEQSTARNGSEK